MPQTSLQRLRKSHCNGLLQLQKLIPEGQRVCSGLWGRFLLRNQSWLAIQS